MASLNAPFVMAAGAALIAVAVGAHSLQSAIHSVEDGREYLQNRGYTNISGGGRDYVNFCGKDVCTRSYEATNPQGKNVTQTVCFKPFFGPHLPFYR